MEAEFVNLYVQKQKQMIDDLTAKVIMLDTKSSLAEAKVQKLAETESIVAELRKQVNDLTLEKEKYRQELSLIKKTAKSISE